MAISVTFQGEISDLPYIPVAEKGAAGGVAVLDAEGRVPTANLPVPPPPPPPTHGIFDVRGFGALGDDNADDTASIQGAIDAAAALPYGGAVLIPPGKYQVGGLKLKSRVTLQGVGPQSILTKRPGAASPVVSLASNAVNHTVLRDLYIDGNRQAGGQGPGIEYVNSEDHAVIRAAELFRFHGDPQHRIANVHVFNANATGIRLWTRECQVSNCHIARCQVGLELPGSDNWVSDTSINNTMQRGVVVEGGNNRLIGVKVWYVGIDSTYAQGDGFYLRASRCTLSGCEAQDISRHGVTIAVADSIAVSGMMLDNIGNLYAAQGVGYNHGTAPRYGISFEDGTNGPLHNRVGAVITQRSAAVGMTNAVRLSPMAAYNQVVFTCSAANTTTGQLVRAEGQSALVNYVLANK